MNILLVGERGTGKSQVARAIHELWRPERPFELADCGAMTAELAASTLFGHERGAFTGATERRIGLVERAGEGTLFLDEVAELPLEVQKRLLVLLSSPPSFERVGGSRRYPFHARVVAATNQAIDETTCPDTMRDDLYDRLSTVVIRVPPLRERRSDIGPLARHILSRTVDRFLASDPALEGRLPRELAPDALDALTIRSYPGNVRELDSVVSRGVGWAMANEHQTVQVADLDVPQHPDLAGDGVDNLDDAVAAYARRLILRALQQAGGVHTRAAEILGVTDSKLRRRRRRYHLDLPNDVDEE